MESKGSLGLTFSSIEQDRRKPDLVKSALSERKALNLRERVQKYKARVMKQLIRAFPGDKGFSIGCIYYDNNREWVDITYYDLGNICTINLEEGTYKLRDDMPEDLRSQVVEELEILCYIEEKDRERRE